MGCASSKQARRDRSPYAPLQRSHSMPVHHPSQRIGDSYHVVALTSTTYGSLKLDESLEQKPKDHGDANGEQTDIKKGTPNGITEKTWSDLINQKIKSKNPLPLRSFTPTITPQNEPETINTWELMEGLEDNSPLCRTPVVDRSFSFHSFTGAKEEFDTFARVKPSMTDSPKPLWLHSGEDLMPPDFDPEVISTFRKAIEELSPRNPVGSPESDVDSTDRRRGIVQARISDFQGKINEGLAKKGLGFSKISPERSRCPPGGEDKVVLYFTSLRGIRKTYEDCCNVRMILQGLGVQVDERDVSMHNGFREEMNTVLGGSFGLPGLFVNGEYVGGAEEVRRLHDAGELGKLLEGWCGSVEPGLACDGCGAVRFVPCDRCSGSCKVFDEEGGLGFIRCPDCNENGIVRCPMCC